MLIVVEAHDEKLELASRNLPHVDVLPVTARRSGEPGRVTSKVLATVGAVKHARGETGMSSKERLMNVLIGAARLREDARGREKHNQFVFRVRRDATKPDIKAAVELMFEVKVDARAGRRTSRQGEALRRRIGRTRISRRPTCASPQGQTIDFEAERQGSVRKE